MSLIINTNQKEKMSYEDFIHLLKNCLEPKAAAHHQMINVLYHGYTSEDEEKRHFIRDLNKSLLQKEADVLLTDVLYFEEKYANGASFCQQYNLTHLYHRYLRTGINEVLELINNTYANETDEKIIEEFVDKQYFDYQAIKEHLMIRPLNYQMHCQELKDCIYRRDGDLTFVLCQFFDFQNKSFISRKIYRNELENWGVAETDDIMKDALTNTARVFPATVYRWDCKKEVNFLEDQEITKENISDYTGHILLSNSQTVNGALALYYPGVLEKMLKIMGGPFDVVFMNINDAMIFELDDDLTEYGARLAAKSTEMGEMLSGKIYRCDLSGIHPLNTQIPS